MRGEAVGRRPNGCHQCSAPGFDLEDFELPTRARLTGLFPQHRALIERLTRA